jgi:uncharacterized membrane protein YdfJ with MMPL/SSD domain
MTQQMTRQIALMTVVTTCMLLIVLVLAFGLGAAARSALTQAFPLVVICAGALAFLVTDPFARR